LQLRDHFARGQVSKLVSQSASARGLTVEQHLRDVNAACQELITLCCTTYPDMAGLHKVHQLAHVADDIRRFGPMDGHSAAVRAAARARASDFDRSRSRISLRLPTRTLAQPFESKHSDSRERATFSNHRNIPELIARHEAQAATVRLLARGGTVLQSGPAGADHGAASAIALSADELAMLASAAGVFKGIANVDGVSTAKTSPTYQAFHLTMAGTKPQQRRGPPAQIADDIRAALRAVDCDDGAIDTRFYTGLRIDHAAGARRGRVVLCTGDWVAFASVDAAGARDHGPLPDESEFGVLLAIVLAPRVAAAAGSDGNRVILVIDCAERVAARARIRDRADFPVGIPLEYQPHTRARLRAVDLTCAGGRTRGPVCVSAASVFHACSVADKCVITKSATPVLQHSAVPEARFYFVNPHLADHDAAPA
jgi:hypothetical protein